MWTKEKRNGKTDSEAPHHSRPEAFTVQESFLIFPTLAHDGCVFSILRARATDLKCVAVP